MIVPRLEVRLERSRKLEYLVPVVSILLALIVAGFLLLATGRNPLQAYWQMFSEAFGTSYGFTEVLVKATPLILCGLGVMLAFKMLFWNIGAEGQLHMGAWAATAVVMTGWDTSPWLMIPAMMLAGMLGGAALGSYPGTSQSEIELQRDHHDTVAELRRHSLGSPLHLRSLEGSGELWLPHDPTVSGRCSAPAVRRQPCPSGSCLRTVGRCGPVLPPGEESMGIRGGGDRWQPRRRGIRRHERRAQRHPGDALSGGLCGLAGMVEVSGIQLKLLKDISPHAAPYGYTAIIVAWLARRNPWGVVLVSILMGGPLCRRRDGADYDEATGQHRLIIQALILFFVLGGDILSRYRLVFDRQEALNGD